MAILTIGIPVFNEGDYLSETINSAISQTLSDIKIIISENASTDNSFKIASEYSKGDPRISVIRQEENIDPLNNFRYVLDEAITPYFVWLGGHDLFEKNYLKKAVDYLESNPETVMVYPENAVFIDKNNNYLSSDACSAIYTKGIEEPLKRVKHIIENLHACTNIHGVYRVNILRQLPFEKVIGSDFLMLAMTGLYGHISTIDRIGVLRRSIRDEDATEAIKRWEEMGVFSSKEGSNPYKKLVELHLHHIKRSKKVGLLDMLFNFYQFRKILSRKFGCVE